MDERAEQQAWWQNYARTMEVAKIILEKLDRNSDTRPTRNGPVISVVDVFNAEKEVIEQVVDLAYCHGVTAMLVRMDRTGQIRFEIQHTLENTCSHCKRTDNRLHDDGICFACRNPNFEPGDQPANEPVSQDFDPILRDAFLEDLRDGADYDGIKDAPFAPSTRAALEDAHKTFLQEKQDAEYHRRANNGGVLGG